MKPHLATSNDDGSIEPALAVLVVCSHNRTRSVMAGAMMQTQLDDLLGRGRVGVTSAGFGPAGLPAIPDAVAAMARRGIDVSTHRSRHLDADLIGTVDLILAAERAHVLRVAGLVASAFTSTFTLPEFVERTDAERPARDLVPVDWLADLGRGRTPSSYLSGGVADVADPTGMSTRRFEVATAAIESMCARAALAIAGGVRTQTVNGQTGAPSTAMNAPVV